MSMDLDSTGGVVLTLVLSVSISLAILAGLKKLPVARWFAPTPSDRSNHHTPKLQLGGLALYPVSVIALILYAHKIASYEPRLLLLFSSFSIAFLLGLIDDVFNISFYIKFLSQFVISALLLLAIIGHLGLFMDTMTLTIAVCALVLVVYWINATNFMDGIDWMIVSGLLLPVLFLSIWLISKPNANTAIAFAGLATAGSLAGFAMYNKPGGTIILGDSGSLLCGTVSAGLIIAASIHLNPVSALLPFLYFFVDTGMTLWTRLCARKNIFKAHSEHAYQIAFRGGNSAYKITLSVGVTTAILCALSYKAQDLNSLIQQLVMLWVGLALAFGVRRHFIRSAE